MAESHDTPLFVSPLKSVHLMWLLRYYLARALAESTALHGVFLDVLGMGVLITGESGVGKSELGLELISRGSGLVADDVVELYRTAPETLEGRCPELLKDFLEVRGLGVLDIRTIFGETSVRPRMNLKLIVHLEKPAGPDAVRLERLPLAASSQNVLGVEVRKVTIPVAAGRNLAVLVEAAVRNYVLQLRGIDSTREFVARHERHMRAGQSGQD
jgi:HPr kinase/phosphorylase